MVVIDATTLMLLFRSDVPARATDSKGKSIDYVPERVTHLVKTVEGSKSRIVIPTPVLSELLAQASRDPPFLSPSASADRVMTASSIAARVSNGSTRNTAARSISSRMHCVSSAVARTKIKFDRQIVAIAKVVQATAIYTDDQNLASTAKTVGIPSIGLAELPLPPETAQGQLPFEAKKPDAADEIAKQAKNLPEPEIPTGAPSTEGSPGPR
jgi:rRNA-processing protein FCF1